MSEYTPGPWKVVFGNSKNFYQISSLSRINNKNGHPRVVYHDFNKELHNWEEDVANAQLIAAAPELLEALEKSQDFILYLLNFFGWEQEKFTEDEIVEKLELNLKAIQKAKGDDK